MPSGIREVVQRELTTTITHFTTISGGCINNGGRMETSGGSYFVKWNNAQRFPHMFASEARGLQLLAAAKCIRTPEVIYHGETMEWQFIVLEFIEEGKASVKYWENLAVNLASLHRVSSGSFGLDHDNYIGSLPQINKETFDWTEFFIHQRLEPQLKLLNPTSVTRKKFERLYSRMPELFPIERPALLHGDLWSGNLVRDNNGSPCVIDPAVYFGYREMELAFTQLFGGFESAFYDTYKEVFPLQPGYEERIDLCNLYPLLVHANLFGGQYLAKIEEIADRWA